MTISCVLIFKIGVNQQSHIVYINNIYYMMLSVKRKTTDAHRSGVIWGQTLMG